LIDELCELLKERGNIHTDEGINGEIECCEIRCKKHDIVCLCHCDDRVYPLKVIVIWVENDQLRYEIRSCSQDKHKNIAIKKYEEERDAKDSFSSLITKKIERKEDQSNIFVEIDDCSF
jgi:hypothetical protein